MRGLSEVVGNFPVQMKYLVVGGFNTVVGYGWFALCYVLFNSFLPYLVIVVASHLTATSFSFLMHHQLVFSRGGGQSVVVMWFKFQYSSLGMMLLGLLMNFILFNWLGLSPWLSQLVAMLVGAGVGFFVHRYFVFASKFRTYEVSMSAIKRLIEIAKTAGFRNSPKVVIGLARMHWRYFLLGRGRGLIKHLPLEAPMKIHVDPASGCNFRCFFCPQTDPQKLRSTGFPMKVMPLELFQKLIDDLQDFDGQVDELVLGNYGEPLINKNLPAMVRYAKLSKKIREVSVITNAALLNGRTLGDLADAGLDKIRISIESLSDRGYLETTGVAQSFEGIIRNIKEFKDAVMKNKNNTFIYIKIIDIGLTAAEKELFFARFLPMADAVSIENLMGVTEKSAEMVKVDPKGMTGVSISKQRKVCPSPFYSLSIHSNGEVGVCCSDWSHKTVVGSIEVESLRDIWGGERLRKFRLDQLEKSWRNMPACAGCEMIHHYPKYEDLDDFIESIKGNFMS